MIWRGANDNYTLWIHVSSTCLYATIHDHMSICVCEQWNESRISSSGINIILMWYQIIWIWLKFIRIKKCRFSPNCFHRSLCFYYFLFLLSDAAFRGDRMYVQISCKGNCHRFFGCSVCVPVNICIECEMLNNFFFRR